MREEIPPPPAPLRPNKWQPIVDGLRAREGRWQNVTDDVLAHVRCPDPAFLRRHLRAVADDITQGRRAAFRPAGSFLARAVDGQIWAVAIPDGHDPADYNRMQSTPAADTEGDRRG